MKTSKREYDRVQRNLAEIARARRTEIKAAGRASAGTEVAYWSLKSRLNAIEAEA